MGLCALNKLAKDWEIDLNNKNGSKQVILHNFTYLYVQLYIVFTYRNTNITPTFKMARSTKGKQYDCKDTSKATWITNKQSLASMVDRRKKVPSTAVHHLGMAHLRCFCIISIRD